MSKREVINEREVAWITAIIIAGGGILYFQQLVVRLSKMDACFSYLAPLLYAFCLIAVFVGLSKRFPGKHLFDITKRLFGKWLGTVVNLVLVTHIWFNLMRNIYSIAKFICTVLLPNTPDQIVMLLVVFVLLYFGSTSIEVAARMNGLFFPAFFMAILMLPIALANEFDFHYLEPVLSVPPVSVIVTNALATGWYGDLFILGAFLHTISNSKQLSAAMRHGTVVATFLLMLVIFLEIAVLGPNIPSQSIYPSFFLIQQIHITDFLDRMDLVLLAIWFPIFFSKLIVIYLAFLIGVSSFAKKCEPALINPPVGLFLLLTTAFSFRSTSEVFDFTNYSSPAIMWAYQPLLFLLLFALSRRVKIAGQPGKGDGSPAKSGRKQSPGNKRPAKTPFAGWADKFGPRTMPWSTTLLIVAACVLTSTGLTVAKQIQALSIAAAYGTGLCILLAVITSYFEIVKAKQT